MVMPRCKYRQRAVFNLSYVYAYILTISVTLFLILTDAMYQQQI